MKDVKKEIQSDERMISWKELGTMHKELKSEVNKEVGFFDAIAGIAKVFGNFLNSLLKG